MPRRRRKYRPPQPELEKKVSPFFAKARHEEMVVKKQAILQTLEQKQIEKVRRIALDILHQLKDAIGNSHLEFGYQQQRKALKLANQMMGEGIWDVYFIQKGLKVICKTLGQGQFGRNHTITHSFGETTCLTIPLTEHFFQENEQDQLYHLLRAAIQATSLTPWQGAPTSRYSATDPATLWTDYILRLCQLLPERPYLITGTPTNTMPPKPIIEEEDTTEEAPEESEEETSVPAGSTESLLPVSSSPSPINLADFSEEAAHTPSLPQQPNTASESEKSGLLNRIRQWFRPNK